MLVMIVQVSADTQDLQITGFSNSDVSKVLLYGSNTSNSFVNSGNDLTIYSAFDSVSSIEHQVAVITLANSVAVPSWNMSTLVFTVASMSTPMSGAFQLVLAGSGDDNDTLTYTGDWSNYSIVNAGAQWVFQLAFTDVEDKDDDTRGEEITTLKSVTLYSTTKTVSVTLENLEATPEPGACILTGIGLLALVLWRGKSRRMSGLL